MKAAFVAMLVAPMLALALFPRSAEAHANLVESEPSANSVLDAAPERVTIRFTEPLEPVLSSIEVLDSFGARVDGDDSTLDPSDATVMSVSVEELDDGTYTVAWKNVSTVDGHRVRGAFVFSIGEPISGTAALDLGDQPLLQSRAEPVVRWLVLLGCMTVVGGLTFRLLVLKPWLASRTVAQGSARPVAPAETGVEGSGAPIDTAQDEPRFLDLGAALSRGHSWIAWAALALFLGASVLQLVLQTAAVFETPVSQHLIPLATDLLFETDWGRLWTWRVLLAVALGVALFVSTRWGYRPWSLTLATLFAVGVLLTIGLTSHAAATPNVSGDAIVNDFIHLVASSVWFGGLVALALTVFVVFRKLDGPDRRSALVALAPRFSLVAGLSVAALVVSGVFSAWAQVTVPAAVAVPYGSALVVKLVLVLLMLLIAGANLVWVRPRLRGDGRAPVWLRRLVTAEVIAGVLVLLAVGFLTSLEPARQVASREGIGAERGLSFGEEDEGASLTLRIEPGQVGSNTIYVSLKDRFGEPITNATDVRVRLSFLDADLGEAPVSAAPLGDGEFVLDGQTISIAGAWQAELVAQRPDAFDARAAFRFEASGGGGSLAIAPAAKTGRVLLGLELGILGLLFLGVGIPLGGWYSRAGAMTMAPGAVGAIAGAVLLFNALGGDVGVQERNPIVPTSDSVAAGLTLYEVHCQACHGIRGLGDGPSAAGLNPPAADLVVHVPLHPDRALFEFVRDGIPGTAMDGVGAKLSDDEIWHLINYIQTFE